MSKNNKDGHVESSDLLIAYAVVGNTTLTAAGSGTALKNDSTSTGGTGSTAFTFADVVAALKKTGMLAQ